MPQVIKTSRIEPSRAKAILSQATGLGVARIQEKLGQTSTYDPYSGMAPAKMSDWDKFMQFNNAIAPVIGNIMGTWIQGRQQAQSAEQMAKMFESMTPQERSYMMQGYMTQQMLLQQGITPQGYDPMMMNNMGQAFNMLPASMRSSTANNAMQQMLAAAGGNAQIRGMINQQDAQFGAGVNLFILIPVALAGIGLVYYLATRK